MTFKTFLKDSEAIFIQIRYRISCKDNISTIVHLHNIYFDYLNKLNKFNFLKSKKKKNALCQLLNKVLNDVVELLKLNAFEQAYDLIDAFHCLPSIFIAHRFDIPENYWKIYVEPYSIRWDPTFLILVKKMYEGLID